MPTLGMDTERKYITYVQASDPGAVGEFVMWADTSIGGGEFVLKVRNAANTGWVLHSTTTGSGGSDIRYVHDQILASTTWVIEHDLGLYPAVMIVDSGGNVVIGDITYTDDMQIVATFTVAFSGKAYLS